MDEGPGPPIELDPQVLAPAAHGHHPATAKGPGEAPGAHPVEDQGVGHGGHAHYPAPGEMALDTPADGLDLGQLGHSWEEAGQPSAGGSPAR